MSLALKLALSPLLVAQALRTRARVPRLPEAAGARDGTLGRGAARAAAADRRRLVGRRRRRGDAGRGAGRPPDAAAAAHAARCGCSGALCARTGLTTAQALRGAARAPTCAVADLAVVVTGVNDVVDQVGSQRAVRARESIANCCATASACSTSCSARCRRSTSFPRCRSRCAGWPAPTRGATTARCARWAGERAATLRRRVDARRSTKCPEPRQHGERRLPSRRAGVPRRGRSARRPHRTTRDAAPAARNPTNQEA